MAQVFLHSFCDCCWFCRNGTFQSPHRIERIHEARDCLIELRQSVIFQLLPMRVVRVVGVERPYLREFLCDFFLGELGCMLADALVASANACVGV